MQFNRIDFQYTIKLCGSIILKTDFIKLYNLTVCSNLESRIETVSVDKGHQWLHIVEPTMCSQRIKKKAIGAAGLKSKGPW